MTSFYQIGNIPVSVSDYHHEVLELWSMVRRDLNSCTSLEVVTLDHHTDVVAAFRGREAVPSGSWMSPEKVSNAIAGLKHDEHIDWAIKSGLLERAQVIAHVNETTPADNRIKVLHDRNFPDEFTQLNEPEKFFPLASRVLDDGFLIPLLGEIPTGKYILDIDCDNFLCRKALYPENNTLWHKLIKNACAITVSKESDYVRILKLRNEDISGDSIAAYLLELFETLLA